MNSADSFANLAAVWKDTPESHETVLTHFYNKMKNVKPLWDLRKWIEENKYGFGHDSFYGVWLQLAKELPDNFKAAELGVYRGQFLSAIDLAAYLENKTCTVYGISSFDGFDGSYYEHRDNYMEDVEYLFSKFNGNRRPVLIRGYTADEVAIETTKLFAPYDVIYVDSDHSYSATSHDLKIYAPMVKVGGYLLSDDSAVGFNLPSWFFAGFEGSSRACDEYFHANEQWQFITNVMHLRIYKRVW